MSIPGQSSLHLALLHEGHEPVPHPVHEEGRDGDTTVESGVSLRPQRPRSDVPHHVGGDVVRLLVTYCLTPGTVFVRLILQFTLKYSSEQIFDTFWVF